MTCTGQTSAHKYDSFNLGADLPGFLAAKQYKTLTGLGRTE